MHILIFRKREDNLATSNIDKNRNATSSWSGYIHQGKVGFLVALRQLKKCLEESLENYRNYCIRYESVEDFDIVDNNGKVLSRHQVKAYIKGIEREDYSDLFNIQTRKIENGKEIIDKKGFQIHRFDGKGNIIDEDVQADARFLHVIVEVKDFNLSEEEYLKKHTNENGKRRRAKYTPNKSQIQLYKYNNINNECFFCPLSEEDDDKVQNYCKDEIRNILKLLNNGLNNNDTHLEYVYFKYVASLLNHSIGKAHSESSFPEILFDEIVKLIKEESPVDEVFEMKKTLFYSWERYCRDNIKNISDDDFKMMDVVVNQLSSMSKESFYKFVRMLLPHEDKNGKFSKLFSSNLMENIFYELLKKGKGFSFNSYSYKDDEKSYRASLIFARKTRVGNLIQCIIKNSEFLKATFQHDFLINESIDDIVIGEKIDEIDENIDLISYKKEWETGVENNIFKSNMKFIRLENAIERELRVLED